MSKRRKTMSEALKYEVAREFGVFDHVQNDGWGNRSARECGSMVKKAIEFANKNVSNNVQNRG